LAQYLKGETLTYVILVFVSVALLLAIAALTKERRLRLALQEILRRFIDRWRTHANTHSPGHTDRPDVDNDGDRM
jgi:hypothetical protein